MQMHPPVLTGEKYRDTKNCVKPLGEILAALSFLGPATVALHANLATLAGRPETLPHVGRLYVCTVFLYDSRPWTPCPPTSGLPPALMCFSSSGARSIRGSLRSLRAICGEMTACAA